MNFSITTDIFCDNFHNWTSGQVMLSSKMWKEMKKTGWTKIGTDKHICPFYNAKNKNKEGVI